MFFHSNFAILQCSDWSGYCTGVVLVNRSALVNLGGAFIVKYTLVRTLFSPLTAENKT